MSVRSLPVGGKFEQSAREALLEADIGTHLRKSSRIKVPSTINFESRMAERANTLKNSSSGYIATLTRLRGNIKEIMDNCGNLEDLKLNQDSYEDAWRKFVKTHEEYIECLDVLSRCEELDRAHDSYKEQIAQKAAFETVIESWKSKAMSTERRDGNIKSLTRKLSKSSKGRSSGSSSASMVLAKRKEQLALAQLKTKQLLREQHLQRKMSELQYERDLMEAEMEEERAMASVNVYKELEDQCRDSQYKERLAELIPEEPLHPTQHQTRKEAQSQLNPLEQPVLRSKPLDEVPEFRDNDRIRISGVKACKTVSTPAPNPVFSATGHTVNAGEAGTCKYADQPYNLKDTEPLGIPLVSPPVLRNELQQVQVPLMPQFKPEEIAGRPTQVPWSQTPGAYPGEFQMREPASFTSDGRLEMVQALRQVVSTPKVEYMRFDGDFETCLEKDNPDNSRRLQLLIQHCYGKARDAIESCVNLPVDEGYHVAKSTLRENFGLPHIIAKAHIRILESLPPLKQADGASLLAFASHLDVANRTLSGMGPEYVSDLNHTNTLRELNKKLPLFMRVKWTECAGRIISRGSRPKFADFLQHLKDRAALVNNEFGEDLTASPSKERDSTKRKDPQGRGAQKWTSLFGGVQDQKGAGKQNQKLPACSVCRGQHRLWKCDKFKNQPHQDKWKVVRDQNLCIKCLQSGHFARDCPQTQFKCRVDGCNRDHNTLLHPRPEDPRPPSADPGQSRERVTGTNTSSDTSGVTSERSAVTAATGAGERVCLSVVPVKVLAKGSNSIPVETYALLDSGSEITLCHESLKEILGISGTRLDFTLSGITGSTRVESQQVDLIVMSMDESVTVELPNVRTVKHMPITESCIAKKEDLKHWPHLHDVELQQLDIRSVMLVVGLKDNPSLFLPLECRAGREGEPVAVRYSLGWTVIGPVGGESCNSECLVNFLRVGDSSVVCTSGLESEDSVLCDGSKDSVVFSEMLDNGDAVKVNVADEGCGLELGPDSSENKVQLQTDETERQARDEELNQQLERLWKTDIESSEVETRVCASLEDKRALEVMERTLKMVDGHFQVALPWRHDPPFLPNNRIVAERRGFLLKKRLLKDEALFEKYKTTMTDYIENGHAEKVPKDELEVKDRPVWYLPHHPVTHPLKPDKVRVVYDCAAKFGQTSLNHQLLQGPDQTNQLVGVLSRFRQETVGMVADIEGMFHQVLVDPKDCDTLRFLWWPNGDLTKEMEEYRMVKHLFGATSLPSVANFCLRKIAQLYQEEFDAEAVETVKRNMYVDDMMKSTSATEKAVSLASQLRKLLEKGGFRLTKWYSNDRELLATIPESERAKSVVNLELEKLPTESALGLKWNTEEDKFVWEVLEKVLHSVNQKPMTRRGIVSAVYSLFDPLGFIAPYVMKAKLLLQTLSRKRLGWDDPLDEADKGQWKRWLEDLPKLQEIQVERCFKPKEFGEVKEVQLHLFSDASRQGYAAVAYLRLKDVFNRIHCAFVMGKARLAPVREISIPRLELTAAVISVKLSKIIREELDMTIDQVHYWTDSTSVLKCINNESKRFHTFESNRLTVIHNGSKPSEWKYVNRDDNPADDGSKGRKIDAMLKNDRWLKGPKFLWENDSHWPKMIEIPVLEDGDPEVRKEGQIYVATLQSNVLDDLISYYSCWWKLKCAIAWLLRYKRYLQVKVQLRKNAAIISDSPVESSEMPLMKCGYLTVAELQVAEKEILTRVQEVAFPEVLNVFSAAECCEDNGHPKKILRKAGASIRQLNPQLKEGLLRVGGRLANAPVGYEKRHPVIIPYKHHVTDLIIKQCHESLGHMGQESVLSSLRETFWIVKGRSAVRRVIGRCMNCQRQRKACPGEQFMASLPEDRLIPDKPPFTYVGIDYFGPLEVKQGRSRVKRYGCLFTCLTTRAVHIEIAHSLDTDSMINALRRFISVRGYPEKIRSDRGSNFTKADKELKEAIEGWNEHKINNFCRQKKIEWIFNPPSASHMGGAWERMIRSVRQILKAILKEQLVSDEVLSTVMAEAVNILNSRPLTHNSDSPLDEQPLTPNHLLHLRPCPGLPPGIFDKDDLSCRRAWRQAQYLANLFWRRWTSEYLPTLLERKKWNTPRTNLEVGDLVLLADESFPRGKWPLGRIVEVMPSRDGLVRTVKVKTSCTVATRAKRQRKGEPVNRDGTTVLTRPVTKLCLLEMD